MEDFKKRYQKKQNNEELTLEQVEKNMEKNRIEKEQRQQKRESKEKRKYLAKKGMSKTRKRRFRVSLVATVLAATLAGGNHVIGSVYSDYQAEKDRSIDRLKEEHVNITRLGLSEQSINELVQYNEFFKNEENRNIDSEEIIQMTRNIEQLNQTIIKEKMALISGYSTSNMRIKTRIDSEAVKKTSIGMYNIGFKEGRTPDIVYQDASANLFRYKDEFTLPKELCNIVWNKEEITELRSKILNRKITDKKAIKQLEKYFKELQNFSSKELIRGKNGKLALVDLIDEKQKEQNKEDMQR